MNTTNYPSLVGTSDVVKGRIAAFPDWGAKCDGSTADNTAIAAAIHDMLTAGSGIAGLRVPANAGNGRMLIDNSTGPLNVLNMKGMLRCEPGTIIVGSSLAHGVLRFGQETKYPYGSNAFVAGASAGSDVLLDRIRIGYVGSPVTRLPGGALEIWNANDWILRDTLIDASPMMGILIGFSQNIRAYNSFFKYTRSDGLHFTNCLNCYAEGIGAIASGEVGDDVVTFQRNDVISGVPAVLNGVNTSTGVLSFASPHGYSNGALVWIASMNSSEQYQAPPAGLFSLVNYYVVSATSTTLKLSLVPGGVPIIPSTGGAGTVFIGAPLLVGQAVIAGLNAANSLASGVSIVGGVDGVTIVAPKVTNTYSDSIRIEAASFSVGFAKNIKVIGGELLGAGQYSNPYQGVHSFEPWGVDLYSNDPTQGHEVEFVGTTIDGTLGNCFYATTGVHNVRFVGCTFRNGGPSAAGSPQLLLNSSGKLEFQGCHFENANDSFIFAPNAEIVWGKGNTFLNGCINSQMLAVGAGTGSPGSTNPTYTYSTAYAMRASVVGQLVDVWSTAGVLVGVGLPISAINTGSHQITLAGNVTGQSNTDILAIASVRATVAIGNGAGTPASTNPTYNTTGTPLGYVGQPIIVLDSTGSTLKGTGVTSAITASTISLTGTFASPSNTDIVRTNTPPIVLNLGRALQFGATQVADFGATIRDNQAIATTLSMFLDSSNQRCTYDIEAFLADGTAFTIGGSPAPVGNFTKGRLMQSGDDQISGTQSLTVGRRVSDNSPIKMSTGGSTVPGVTHELINHWGADEVGMFLQRVTHGEGYGPISLQPSGGAVKAFFGNVSGNDSVYLLLTRGSMSSVSGSEQALGLYPTMSGANVVDFRIQGLHNGVGYPPIKMQSDGGVVRMGSDQRITGVPAMASSGFGPFLTSEIGSTLMGDGSLIIDNAGNGALYVIISGVKYRVLTSNDIGGTVAAHTHVHHYLMPATGTDSITATDV